MYECGTAMLVYTVYAADVIIQGESVEQGRYQFDKC